MRAAAALLVAALAAACGGGDGGSPSPNPNPNPSPTPQDPCAAARIEAEAIEAPAGDGRTKVRSFDGTPRWRVLDALWAHQQHRRPSFGTTPVAATSADVGQIAVLRDEGDLIVPANAFDLRGIGLRFSRNGNGGYDVRRADGASFRSALGNRLTLGDDDSTRVDVPFAFPFFGGSEQTAFVNSDGNITFGEGDNASTDRNIARFATGAPRVALFFADLDPTTAGGIYANAASDAYTVTWCNIRGFDSTQATSAQATLLPDGTIEMRFGSTISLADAVVGVSPGRTTSFAAANLDGGAQTADAVALGERFSATAELDMVAVGRAFYQSHPDAYDQLIVWTDTRVVGVDTFAFETTIANEIQGIGQDIYDFSRDFGSGGRLRSYAIMDNLGKYPDDPAARVLGENSTLSVLAHEVGHRWLAYFEFRNHNREQSDALLGRQRAHWSYFFDSDASVMEGNDIEDLGGGSFRTVGTVRRYSRLDQYAMGLLGETDVPPFFYVENPVNLSQQKDRESAPATGITFNGTRRDVLLEDVIAVVGRRVPHSSSAPRVHRQAFIYIVRAGRQVEGSEVAKVERIRSQFEDFFLTATDGRMRADTRLTQ